MCQRIARAPLNARESKISALQTLFCSNWQYLYCVSPGQCIVAAGEISGYSVWFKWAFMDVTSNLENGNILDGAFMYFLRKRAVKMVYVYFHKMPIYNTTTEPI